MRSLLSDLKLGLLMGSVQVLLLAKLGSTQQRVRPNGLATS